MFTRFGPEAKDGDYVIVLDADYVHRRATNYLGKVYKDKVYTGKKMNGGRGKYIHKLIAEMVIDESYVPEERKEEIEEDIAASAIKTKKNKGEKS